MTGEHDESLSLSLSLELLPITRDKVDSGVQCVSGAPEADGELEGTSVRVSDQEGAIRLPIQLSLRCVDSDCAPIPAVFGHLPPFVGHRSGPRCGEVHVDVVVLQQGYGCGVEMHEFCCILTDSGRNDVIALLLSP